MSPATITAERELARILSENRLHAVFQPIVDLQKIRLHGYETLIRGPEDGILHLPTNLFDTATEFDRLVDLEVESRHTSIAEFMSQAGEGKLFLNASPIVLLEPEYQRGSTLKLLERHALGPERVVIELSEQYPLNDYEVMRRGVDHFRSEGFEVAMDDFGAGYAGLRAWSELRPDYVKIDRHFIDCVNRDPIKREFVRGIQAMATELNCRVVAEGIETSEQLITVQAMGIRYAQGYFIGYPSQVAESAEAILERYRKVSLPIKEAHRLGEKVGQICEPCEGVAPSTRLEVVLERFAADRTLGCLPVIENDRPVGLVERHAILELFVGRYSRELHGRKPISQFMDSSGIVVSESSRLDEVGRLISAGADTLLYQHLIVTQNGRYFGIAKTGSVLQRLNEEKLRSARYSNPLTLLPGNVPIYEVIDELLANQVDFHIAYCDLNHFKPFNDHYGYGRGDDVLMMLGQLMQNVIDDSCDFVGHIGGDDFVLIFRSEDWEARCNKLCETVEQEFRQFHAQEDLANGGYTAKNRTGEEQRFPLLSLAIGVCRPDSEYCRSHHDVAELASEAKKQAKMQGGNTVFLSRRRRPDHGHAVPLAKAVAD